MGGVILAAVTSLPNAVAGIYLASHGRGAATLSVALNSNTLNVAFGLLLPATIVGAHAATSGAALTAAWYCGLTVLVLALAYAGRGLDWRAGIAIVIVYLAFVAVLIAS